MIPSTPATLNASACWVMSTAVAELVWLVTTLHPGYLPMFRSMTLCTVGPNAVFTNVRPIFFIFIVLHA